MEIIENLKEYFRPELKIRQDIVEREKKFNDQDANRRNWMLDNTYLCKGGFEQLRQEKNYSALPHNKIIYYLNYKRPKKVRVKTDKGDLLEDKLKEALFLRGCNAGIFHKNFSIDGSFIAEAVPVIITTE